MSLFDRPRISVCACLLAVALGWLFVAALIPLSPAVAQGPPNPYGLIYCKDGSGCGTGTAAECKELCYFNNPCPADKCCCYDNHIYWICTSDPAYCN